MLTSRAPCVPPRRLPRHCGGHCYTAPCGGLRDPTMLMLYRCQVVDDHPACFKILNYGYGIGHQVLSQALFQELFHLLYSIEKMMIYF